MVKKENKTVALPVIECYWPGSASHHATAAIYNECWKGGQLKMAVCFFWITFSLSTFFRDTLFSRIYDNYAKLPTCIVYFVCKFDECQTKTVLWVVRRKARENVGNLGEFFSFWIIIHGEDFVKITRVISWTADDRQTDWLTDVDGRVLRPQPSL